MIYQNKLYPIFDIAQKLKIKESDIYSLIKAKVIPAVNDYGIDYLKGFIALNLIKEIKKFNEKKDVIEIKEEDILNG